MLTRRKKNCTELTIGGFAYQHSRLLVTVPASSETSRPIREVYLRMTANKRKYHQEHSQTGKHRKTNSTQSGSSTVPKRGQESL